MLALYLLLPLLCIAAAGSKEGGPGDRLVRGVALYQALLFAIGTVLGLAHALAPAVYGGVTAVAVLALAVPAWRNRPAPLVDLRSLRTRRGALIAVGAAGVAALFLLQLLRDASWGTGHADGLWYHLPRIVAWAGQGSFEVWTTPTWAQVGLPVGADVVLGAEVFLGLGWAGTAWVTAWLTLGAMACVHVVALDLGLGRTRALLAALLFASFPAIGRRVGAVNSDIAAAFPVMAAYVVLVRGQGRWRLGVFLFLNALGIACRPTVAPLALITSALAVWRAPVRPRPDARAFAGAAAGVAAVLASYWPVHAAFGDFLGGAFGRAHVPGSAGEFLRGVAVSTTQWAMEPLGYLPGARLQAWGRDAAWGVLVALGAPFPGGPYAASQGMAVWTSYRIPDVGRSGLVPLLGLPVVAALLPARARRIALPTWILGFVLVSGMVYLQPWSSRFTVIVLAGFALLWAGPGVMARRRWILPVIVAANVGAALLLTSRSLGAVAGARDRVEPPARCMADTDRQRIADGRGGSPLLVISDGNVCDALLAGPGLPFPTRYLTCPAGGDWVRMLREAGAGSRFLAVNHLGRKGFVPGPTWTRPGVHACSVVSLAGIEEALSVAGWKPVRRAPAADLWERVER